MLRLTPIRLLGTAPSDATTIAALLCCHNRRELTVRCLQSIREQVIDDPVCLAVVIFDDGSTDGTAGAIRSTIPEATVIAGDGSAFWARAMANAQDFALESAMPDFLLWLNDDVVLENRALVTLLRTASARPHAVVVGAFADDESGLLTYSGHARVGRRPTQVEHVKPSAVPTPVDTFNGNLVLVPRAVYQRVGKIDGGYAHALGDTDYGYRVKAAGFEVFLAPGLQGFCRANGSKGTWRDRALSRRTRVRLLFSRKGVPFRSFARFQRRHGGRLWIVNVLGRYTTALGDIFFERGEDGRPQADGHATASVRRRSV